MYIACICFYMDAIKKLKYKIKDAFYMHSMRSIKSLQWNKEHKCKWLKISISHIYLHITESLKRFKNWILKRSDKRLLLPSLHYQFLHVFYMYRTKFCWVCIWFSRYLFLGKELDFHRYFVDHTAKYMFL